MSDFIKWQRLNVRSRNNSRLICRIVQKCAVILGSRKFASFGAVDRGKFSAVFFEEGAIKCKFYYENSTDAMRSLARSLSHSVVVNRKSSDGRGGSKEEGGNKTTVLGSNQSQERRRRESAEKKASKCFNGSFLFIKRHWRGGEKE